MMRRRSVAAGALALVAAPAVLRNAHAQGSAPGTVSGKTTIQFWHGLTQPLGGILEGLAKEFSDSQGNYAVEASFRGSYPETMVAAIAAFRANSAPHIVQMFEVGTATMIAAGRAVKPLHELIRETGVAIDTDDIIPPVKGYYALADGRLMSMPFNSSTAITYYNKDAFRKAGLDPDKFPATWEGVEAAARKLKAAGVATPVSTSWPTWLHVEELSAIHDVPLATQQNGFTGLNAELTVDNPLVRKHWANLAKWQSEGLFRYGGRDAAGDSIFPAGEAAITFASSGMRARVVKEAQFDWGVAMLPFYEGTSPRNSIIGGASFWAMNKGPSAGATGGRTPAEWKAVTEFYRFLNEPERAAKWHQDTGYVPVTKKGYELTRASGFYTKNPGADVPIEQMLRGGDTTPNTRGIRLGGFPEIRTIMAEEMERTFQGAQTADQALSNAQRRGNTVLRNFERANKA
ncbi:sn-glycerol-3-phosphate ABC transporter substrate-binding protein UgpB [Roseomonas elaeocarpi]|uniref:sn-glycerol-3-phosphate-binding periplasmic protein UgpB n=1 Tax=Roseomonas elaeocarpi TaxID=907779 RepID=A0ABV6JNU5_9PROT